MRTTSLPRQKYLLRNFYQSLWMGIKRLRRLRLRNLDLDAETEEMEKVCRGWRCLEAEDWTGQGPSWAVAPQKKKNDISTAHCPPEPAIVLKPYWCAPVQMTSAVTITVTCPCSPKQDAVSHFSTTFFRSSDRFDHCPFVLRLMSYAKMDLEEKRATWGLQIP